MFEHLRNYKLILNYLNHALKPDGKLFIHIFCHKKLTYLYEMKNNFDWMTKYFFQGGIMPSKDIFQYFEDELEIINQWDINGNHYSKTCKAWLNNHYKNKGFIDIQIGYTVEYLESNKVNIFFKINEGNKYSFSEVAILDIEKILNNSNTN